MKNFIAGSTMVLSVVSTVAAAICYWMLYLSEDPTIPGRGGHGAGMAVGIFVMFVLVPISVVCLVLAAAYLRERNVILVSLLPFVVFAATYFKSIKVEKALRRNRAVMDSEWKEKKKELEARVYSPEDHQHLVGKTIMDIEALFPVGVYSRRYIPNTNLEIDYSKLHFNGMTVTFQTANNDRVNKVVRVGPPEPEPH